MKTAITLRAVIAAVWLLAAACSSDRDPTPPAAVAESPTPEVVAPGASRPPPATAASGGATVPLGIGTYCWSEPGKSGVCSDAIGPVTGAQALSVPAGATISVPNPVSGGAIKEANVTAWSGLSSRPIQNGEQVWILGGGASTAIASAISSTGLTFAAPATPGTYVVDIGLTYSQGGVSYGLLLQVR